MAYDYNYIVGEEDEDVTYTYDPVIDVSAPAVLTLTFKRDIEQSTADITIANTAFDKTNAATGVIKWPFDSDDLDTAGTYYGELKAVIDADNTIKKFITMRVRESGS